MPGALIRQADIADRGKDDAMDELRQGDWFSLKGQVAVVTGAGAGIGEASARALARAGAAVVVSDRTLETALAVAEGLVLEGCRAVAVEADVFKDEHLVNLVDTAVNQFGGMNILVNNVGGGGKDTFVETTDDDWAAAFDLTLWPAICPAGLKVKVLVTSLVVVDPSSRSRPSEVSRDTSS